MDFNQFLQEHFLPNEGCDLTERRLNSLYNNPNVLFNTQTIKLQDDLIDQISGIGKHEGNAERWASQIAENQMLITKLRKNGFTKLADKESKKVDLMKEKGC